MPDGKRRSLQVVLDKQGRGTDKVGTNVTVYTNSQSTRNVPRRDRAANRFNEYLRRPSRYLIPPAGAGPLDLLMAS